jgi:hypothetical protein
MKLYHYVGPKQIADRVKDGAAGYKIRSPEDVRAWVRNTAQNLSHGTVIATFVVDASGLLTVADRRSEHVMCAAGQSVLSAGEITFVIGDTIDISEISNYSTGYCPEPESWSAVAFALSQAMLVVPKGLTLVCEFRRCVACGNLTLIKDGAFDCGSCGMDLPATYNVQG